MTRLPVWRNADGTERGRLQAVSCSLDLSVTDLPKATITIPSVDEIPSTHDFVEIFTEHGSAGVFRVVSSTYRYGQTCQLQLIGAADTLSDDIWPATEDEATRTVSQWIQLILSKQNTQRWKFGTCALSASLKMKVNYSELWAMLEECRNVRPGYRWQYDFSTSPWTLSLVKMPDTVSSEFRVTRNVESAQITVSDQQMCNRLIFTVTDGNDGDPVVTTYNNTTSQQKYGIRARCTDIKTDEIPTGMTAAQYAQQLLSEHAVPDISIQINGSDLSTLTGMDLDHFDLGYLCRAVLPEYGEAVEERIVALSYPNVISEPHSVRVSLSTQLGDITGSIASAKKVAQAVQRARGGGGGGAKADKDSWAKVLTDVIEATDGTGIKQMWQSGIEMSSHGGVRLFSLYQGLSSLDSELTIANNAISAEVTRATAAENTLSGRISVQAGKISLVVEETSGGNAIKAASIVAAINDAGSSVVISADHINLNGYVTASQLATQKARIDNLLNGTTVADELRASAARLGNSSGGTVYIYGQQVRVYTITDDYGTARHVYGYT